jgi:hypothetical protein
VIALWLIQRTINFFANIRAVNYWIENLYSLRSDQGNEPLKWIKLMLNVNLQDRPTAQTLFSMITNQHADSANSFNPKMFCGLYYVKDDESPPFSESDEERWINEPEEQRTPLLYLLLINLDPVLAQADQCSAVLESNTLQNQDLDHGSGDALGNNVFSGCDNTEGVGLSSSMDIDHVQATILPHEFYYTFPGCDNNEDKDGDDNNRGGFSSRTNSVNHLQSAHKVRRRRNCVLPDCDNNKGNGYLCLAQHIRSFHLSQKSNCSFPGCDNNGGKGFWDSSTLGNHMQSIHLGQIWNCTFPGCSNNQRRGFSRPSLLKGHVRSVHEGQKFNCTFPGCDKNDGRGFSRSTLLRYHIRSAHSGKKSQLDFPRP